MKAWTRASALSYLNTTTGTKSTRISDTAKLLNEAELKTFLAKIAETKKMA